MKRFNLLIKNVGHYISRWSEEKKLFAWSMLFLCVLFVVPSNKVFLLVSFLFITGLYFIWNNLILAVLYGYILLLPFQNGKGIDFLVVPGEFVYGNIPFVMTFIETLYSL